MTNSDREDITPSTHWGWYAASLLTAIIMALSSAVISFNFMVAQTPLIVSASCAACGFMLNLLLYWRGKAKKLKSFVNELVQNPKHTLYHCMTSILPSIAMGFLTFISYVEQLQSLPSTTQSHIPVFFLSSILAIANVLGSVILYYNAKNPKTTPSEKPTTKQKTLWEHTKEIHATLQSQYQSLTSMTVKQYSALMISLAQSALYSITNYQCMQRSFSMIMPLLNNRYTHTASMLIQHYFYLSPVWLSTAICALLTTTLFNTELIFNYEKLEKITSPVTVPRIQAVLTCMILLNGFANGWITLGDFTHLPLIARMGMVLVGTVVSCAVMQAETRAVNFENVDLLSDFIPNSFDELASMLMTVIQVPIATLLIYLAFNQQAMLALFTSNPVFVIGSFFFVAGTTIPAVIKNSSDAWLQLQFTNTPSYTNSQTLGDYREAAENHDKNRSSLNEDEHFHVNQVAAP